MAIKKRPVSPRQKMINLMYVILMAMLALNTPTDEEFGVKGKSVVEKIKKSLADDGKKSDEEKKNIDLVELNVNELDAFVIPEKTTLYAGERFNSHVVMAAIDSTQRPEIYVNGSRLNAENGRYSFVAGGVGEHQFGGYYFDGVDTGCEVCYFDSLNIIFYAFYTSSRKREDVYALYFFAFHRDVIGCRIRSYCNAVVFYLVYTRGVFTDYFNEYCF